MAKRKKGRPTALTREVHEMLVRLLRRGAYITHAAPAVGVGPRTVMKWLAIGRRDIEEGRDSIHADLASDVEAARNEAAVHMTEVVYEAAKNRDVKAAQWYLERVHPNEFGPPKDGVDRSSSHMTVLSEQEESEFEELSDAELELLESTLLDAEKIMHGGKRRR